MKIPVEGNPNLYRDNGSGAILNCSDSEYQSYIQLKNKRIRELEELDEMRKNSQKVDDLRSEVEEIKNIMQLILKKIDSIDK